MDIIEYDYNTRIEYSKFIRKYNKSKYLNTLNIQTFSKGKKIFLVIEKTILYRYKIVGYAIVYGDLHVMCYSNNISKKYDGDDENIFVSDFMIDYPYRNQGIGKFLAKYILDEVYKDKNIILQPDGDGNWFWKKFGFVHDKISQHTTLILKKKNNKIDIGEIRYE